MRHTLDVGLLQPFYLLEKSLQRPRREATPFVSLVAHYGVRLSRARLAISEDADIVAVDDAGHQRGELVKDALLGRGVLEDLLKDILMDNRMMRR